MSQIVTTFAWDCGFPETVVPAYEGNGRQLIIKRLELENRDRGRESKITIIVQVIGPTDLALAYNDCKRFMEMLAQEMSPDRITFVEPSALELCYESPAAHLRPCVVAVEKLMARYLKLCKLCGIAANSIPVPQVKNELFATYVGMGPDGDKVVQQLSLGEYLFRKLSTTDGGEAPYMGEESFWREEFHYNYC